MEKRKYKKQNKKWRKINKSIRARKTLKILLENGGKSLSKAAIEAGYSPAYAKDPQKLKRTRAWKEICEEDLSDELLSKVHLKLLNNKKSVRANIAGLDMGYKVKGHYAPEQFQLVKRKYQDLSNAELADLEKTLVKFLLKK